MKTSRSLLKYSLSLAAGRHSRSGRGDGPEPRAGGLRRDDQRRRHRPKSGQKISGALVIIQCTCLQGAREVMTNADGLYTFRNLPQGKYTVQVLYQDANVNKTMDVPPGAKLRANFQIDPKLKFRVDIEVQTKTRNDAAQVTKVKMDEARNIPVGGTSRDFTAVVDIVADRQPRRRRHPRSPARPAPRPSTPSTGQNVTNPAFGTVGATIVQEFIQDVEIKESGYDAEFGGASGGQVVARAARPAATSCAAKRLFRFTPRLAQPRFICATDESLRVAAGRRLRGAGAWSRCRARSRRTSCSSRSASRPSGTSSSR